MSKKKNTPKKVKKDIKVSKNKTSKKVVAVKSLKKSPIKPVKATKKLAKSAPSSAGKSKKTLVPLKKVAAKPVLKKVEKKVAKPISKNVANGVVKKPIAKVEVVKTKAASTSAKEEKPVKLVVKKEETVKVKPAKEKTSRGKGGRKPKKKDDDDEPEIIHDELIEQLIQSTKRKKQGPKVPKILKTFVNPMTSLTVAPSKNDNKKDGNTPKKEPKGKFELEYVIRTSAGILYEFITTPSGLSEWFADDVNIRDGVFTFFWDGSEQKANLLGFKEDKFIRLHWLDKPDGTYFEFKIEKDDLTGDISLIIIDFADEASDMQTSKRLWDSQINILLGVLGSN
jgi:uncharacterized protein YndB with AHSA1/START domain